MFDVSQIASAISLLKRATDVAKQANNLEMQQLVMDLRETVIEMREEILRLRTETAQLEHQISLRAAMVFDEPAYFQIDGDEKVGPFCQTCWDKSGLVVRLHVRADENYWRCTVCGGAFDKPGRLGGRDYLQSWR